MSQEGMGGQEGGGATGGGSGAPTTATYLLQVANGSLSNAQAMGALATGLVKSTTTTGVQSIAIPDTDYATPTGVVTYVAANAVPLTRNLVAGAGMTGGGTMAANRTFDVVANADGSIVVNADDIQVGVLATNAQHGNRGGGGLHANVVAAGAAGFMSGADKTKLDAVPTQTLAALYANGASTANSTITVDATRGGVVVTSLSLDDVVPLTLNNTNIDTTGDEQNVLVMTGSLTVASGATTLVPLSLAYTINQTGTASGAVTGIRLNATETAVLGTHRLLDLQVGGVSKFVVTNAGLVAGSTAASGGLTIAGTTNATKGSVTIGATPLAVFNMNMTIASGAAVVLDSVSVPTNTVTVTGTTGIATALGFNYVTLKAPTITDASACTITNSGTLVVSGAPIAAGSAVITNAYALWVQGGASLFDGTNTATKVPLKVLNGLTLSGIEAQVTGTAATGFVLKDSSGTRQGAVGLAVAIGDWVANSAAGDVVITGPASAGSKRLLLKNLSSGGVVILSPGSTGVGNLGSLVIDDVTGTKLGYGASSTLLFTAGAWQFNTNTNVLNSTAAGVSLSGATTQKVGIFGATPIVQPTRGATLTNNVTSGGTDDTIANFTDLTVYANDAAAIRNDIYQLARAVRMHDVALRAFGLES